MANNDYLVCRYCGKQASGRGCLYSPDGYHEAVGDADHCIRCQSSNYGAGCLYPSKDNKKKIHIHGHGKSLKDGKLHCVYCGKVMAPGTAGAGCLYSPNGKHQA